MSSLDSLNLPAVISSVAALLPEPKVVDPAGSKSVVIVYSKDLSDTDLALIKEYGKVLQWDDHLVNLPFASLVFDYLLIDLRAKSARIELGKQDLSAFSVAAYVPWVQKSEAFVTQLDAHPITSFPTKCVSKADFDTQLMNDKIKSPSLVKSLFQLVLSCLQK